ncbi:MAG: AroM family protein [Candidatus Heimdallarchaeota archaeon]
MKDPSDERTQIGMLTIGQSPRTDVISDINNILGSNVEIIECGALDGLSLEEIKKLEPSSIGEYVLVTRLQDGTEVKVSREKIIARMNQCLKKLEKRSKIVIILCTGNFPEFHPQKLLIEPSNLICSVVQSLLPKGRLGVLIPTPEQAQAIASKWKREGITLKIQALSPYQDTKTETVQEIANRFKDCDLIVLDCMGYTKRIGDLIKTMTGIPVIVSKTLVARIVRGLI